MRCPICCAPTFVGVEHECRVSSISQLEQLEKSLAVLNEKFKESEKLMKQLVDATEHAVQVIEALGQQQGIDVSEDIATVNQIALGLPRG